MKYIDEFRDGEVAKKLAAAIRAEADPGRRYHFMEFCGGHTHAISRYGVSDLLPDNVRMIHGPGCPVCVLPIGRVDQAIGLALEHGVTLCTYGDCLRVPASGSLSLLKAKAKGGDIRMVYSSMDAVALDRSTRTGRSFSSRSLRDDDAADRGGDQAGRGARADDFSVLCSHVLTPSAITSILESPEVRRWGTERSTASSARRTSRRSSAAGLRILRRGNTASRWSSPASSRST
jgi:hydrogenase expression/formation protein HypD